MRTIRRLTSQRGFSLAEVLIAMALLSVIVLAVTGLTTASMRRAYAGRKMTEGAVLAQSILERVNRVSAQNLMPTTASAGVTVAADQRTYTWTKQSGAVTPAAEATTVPGYAERNTWRTMFENAELPHGNTAATAAQLIVDMRALPTGTGRTFNNASMNRISVTVRWTEAGERVRRVHLETLNLPN